MSPESNKSHKSITISLSQRQEEAAIIISEYLVSGAPNSINIDAGVREEVVRNCHIAHPALFKPMQKQVNNIKPFI